MTLYNDWKFQCVAHRGLHHSHLENTLPAFEAAVEAGATMVELDVQLTKDHVVVIYHDDTLSKFANDNRSISNITWEELKTKELRDQHQFGKVLSLKKLFKKVKNKINYYIEIKAFKHHTQQHRELLCDQVAKLVFQYKLLENAIVVSFDFDVLRYLFHHYPTLHLGLNIDKSWPTEERLKELKKMKAILCPNKQLLEEKAVQNLKNQGFRIIPWTINDPQQMHQLIQWKVDGITTDKLNILGSVLKT